MGPMEILLILLLGFLFFGPEKLPQMAAKAGKLYRNFRKATFDLSKSITDEVASEEKSIKKDLSEIRRSFTADLSTGFNEEKQSQEDLKNSGEQPHGETQDKPESPANEDK